MKHGSLFSGIGGFDLGFSRAGIETLWEVEIDPYCRKVLERHFPNAERFADIRECGKHNLRPVDVISGGFPCQDISQAGKRAGIDGDRSGLWREYARIIGELRPRYVCIENVAALLGRGLVRVLCDLAALGYDAEWEVISAADVGAPHLRERVWIVAYPNAGRKLQPEGIEFDQWRWVSDRSEAMGYPAGSGFPDWAGGEMGQPSPLTEFERPGGEDVADSEHDGSHSQKAHAAKSRRNKSDDGVSIGSSSVKEREIERVVCRVVTRISNRLDDGGLSGATSQGGTSKRLQDVWDSVDPQEVRRATGRLLGISPQKILRLELHGEGQDQREPRSFGASLESSEVDTEESLRGLRHEASAAGSPQRQEHREQREGEPSGLVLNLSHETPLEHGQGSAIAVYLAVEKRVNRLKALGNSIVPQIAEIIGRRITKAG